MPCSSYICAVPHLTEGRVKLTFLTHSIDSANLSSAIEDSWKVTILFQELKNSRTQELKNSRTQELCNSLPFVLHPLQNALGIADTGCSWLHFL